MMIHRETNRRHTRRACAGWLAVAALAHALAFATEGEQVISGEATFTRDGSLLQIDTTTPQTIINWSGGFDIAPGATVQINQPNALSNTLNYDLTTDPSRIEGSLFSNGGVWIINPVGVFFGDHAIVDVGRLVAGGGKIDAGDFLAGTERFTNLTGNVEVAAGAQIRAADSVLLVGAAVANYGNISSADGMIALVAGGEVRLARTDGRVIVTADRAIAPDPERWAIVQAGTLDAGKGSVSLTAGDAYSLAINHTGITRARDIAVAGGENGLVSVAGAIDASDHSAGATGGAITVTGDRVALLGAQLDASGDAGGGEIRVGGDLRGGGELPTAQRTYVDGASSLRADAIATGNGGTIIVWSDEATRFYGALSARGGASSGDGGFAEISGASLVARGSVDLGASAGNAGTLLYDPKDIVIHAGDDPLVPGESVSQVLFGTPDELTTPFDIYETELETANANILLQATNSISSTESFTVDLGTRSLDMDTRNNAGDEAGTSFAPGIHLADDSFSVSFATAGGSIDLSTGNGSIEVGNLTTSGADGATGGAGGNVTLAAGGSVCCTPGFNAFKFFSWFDAARPSCKSPTASPHRATRAKVCLPPRDRASRGPNRMTPRAPASFLVQIDLDKGRHRSLSWSRSEQHTDSRDDQGGDAQSPVRVLRRQWPPARKPHPHVLLVRHGGEPVALGDPPLSRRRAALRRPASRR